jgi:hypothetical protein
MISVEAHKKLVPEQSFVRGIVLTPREPRRATLVKSVIELPSLMR